MNSIWDRWPILLLMPLLAGCFRPPAAPPDAVFVARENHPDSSKYLATEEPAGARNVIDLRKEARDGDEIVIVGRIGGSRAPLVKGRAAFSIVDLSLKSCDDDPNCYDFA